MLAFGLSILLFFFWCVMGYAITAVLRVQCKPLENAFLAPVVGLAVTLLPIFWFNRLGNPVSSFGKTLALVLFLGSIALLWRFHPKLTWREYLPFACIFLLAAILIGRPMLEFGFNWVSYANDDMANYCLAAHRLLNQGFFDTPKADDLIRGRDYTQFYWFLYIPAGIRTGSELLLAWVCSITGLTAHQIFMPTILALHLTLISATGALVLQFTSFRLAAFVTCSLLSLSALNSLGTLLQLIAQVSGLGLLIGCITLLLSPLNELKFKAIALHGILTAILLAALLLVYPEVFPFLVLSFLLHITIGLVQRRIAIKPLSLMCSIVVLITSATLNTYLLKLLVFLLIQTSTGIEDKNPNEFSFPYYLVPSGLASLWGMQRFSDLSPEPWLSITIAISTLLSIILIGIAIWLTWLRQPIATLTLVMLVFGIFLFAHRSDFGLFKLAMFIQPFMIGTIAIFCTRFIRRTPIIQIIPLVLVGLLNFQTQSNYLEVSRGVKGFSEIPNISQLKINEEFQKLINNLTLTSSQNLILNTHSIVLAKFQALYTQGKTTLFPTQGVFFNALAEGGTHTAANAFPKAELTQIASELTRRLQENEYKAKFNLLKEEGADSGSSSTSFSIPNFKQMKADVNDSLLINPGFKQSIFNGRHISAAQHKSFVAQSWKKTQNQLMLINSDLGYEYYLGNILQVNPEQIAIQQLERDQYRKGQALAGFGQHLLFQSINPSEQARLSLEVTTSLNGDGENRLPAAAVIGEKRQAIGLIGRGSARVFSPPLNPQIIAEFPYIAIDMGVSGKPFRNHKTGLMNLYGKDIQLDQRKIVGFGRDISLISQEEYANLKAPNSLSHFPEDLSNSDLEYSGIYEDGWVSEAAFLRLTQPTSTAQLLVRGIVPVVKDPSFTSKLQILVDGNQVANHPLKTGEFNIQIDIPNKAGQRRIDLRFSKFQSLPAGDDRPVAAQLKFIGFKENG